MLDRRSQRPHVSVIRAGLWALIWYLATLLIASSGLAQFYGNAVPAELLNLNAGNVWFGSVRTAGGMFVEDATVRLDTGLIEYVAVTDLNGRFRLVLPEATLPSQVTPSCAQKNFQANDVRVRIPSRLATSPIEVSCLLR